MCSLYFIANSILRNYLVFCSRKKKLMRILMVCGANSCRSQIAEAFCRAYHGTTIVVESCGNKEPAAYVNKRATEVMKNEFQIDMTQQYPKHIKQFAYV